MREGRVILEVEAQPRRIHEDEFALQPHLQLALHLEQIAHGAGVGAEDLHEPRLDALEAGEPPYEIMRDFAAGHPSVSEGREILLDLARARGHEVTAFVRSPEKLERMLGIRVVGGDPLRADSIASWATCADWSVFCEICWTERASSATDCETLPICCAWVAEPTARCSDEASTWPALRATWSVVWWTFETILRSSSSM